MDIRDIKDEVPKVNNDALQQIFNLQEELLSHYRKIEGLPEFPLNLDIKASQAIIKDFTARVVEELGECFESYIMMERVVFNQNGPDMDTAVNHLQNLNEELSDAIHFYIELLIAAGIGNDMLYQYIQGKYPKFGVSYDKLIQKKDALGLGLWLQSGFQLPYYEGGTWVITDKDLEDEFLRGGRYLGTADYKREFKSLLWDITYDLQLARNALKNKPWKQTQMLTDQNIFRNYLCGTFLSFCRLFVFLGMTEEAIFTIYFKKNRINLFRIKSKY